MNTIISPADLHTALQQPQHSIVLLDCRFTLGKPEAGADAYQNEHLPDAHYLDLEKICPLWLLLTEADTRCPMFKSSLRSSAA